MTDVARAIMDRLGSTPDGLAGMQRAYFERGLYAVGAWMQECLPAGHIDSFAFQPDLSFYESVLKRIEPLFRASAGYDIYDFQRLLRVE